MTDRMEIGDTDQPSASEGGSSGSSFPITTTAAALVEIESGGRREMHWHPQADEWQYWIEGQGRMTVFASGSSASTFDYQGAT